MTKKEKEQCIEYAHLTNNYLVSNNKKRIPINTYEVVLEHIRKGIDPVMFPYINGVSTRRRTKRGTIGDIFYTNNIAIVPISRGVEAYFSLVE